MGTLLDPECRTKVPICSVHRYYLEETNGDIKAAVQLARLDETWEHVAGSRHQRQFFDNALRGQA